MILKIDLADGCYVDADVEIRPEPKRCRDCGDPATTEADEIVSNSIWGIVTLPKIPVCPPCYRRRTGK